MNKQIKKILEIMSELSLEQIGEFIRVTKETNVVYNTVNLKEEKHYNFVINEDVALALENLYDLLMSNRKEIKYK